MPTDAQKLEIYRELLEQVGSGARAGGAIAQASFVQVFCEFLAEQAHFVPDLIPVHFAEKWRSSTVRVDGYHLDEQTYDLTLAVSDFSPFATPETITKEEAKRAFEQVRRFFRCCSKKDFREEIEDSSEAYRLAKLIADNNHQIARVRYILMTNRTIGDRVKDGAFDDLKASETIASEYTVWDFSRYAECLLASAASAEIEVDCMTHSPDGKGLRYLDSSDAAAAPSAAGRPRYVAYLLMLPGQCVYDWYAKYADRLLEQNIRTFLQFKGSVNRGIRDTVKHTPDLFLAYNNGLTATASKVEIDEKTGRIVKIVNLQIVNGGQTTASIYTAGKDYPDSLAAIKVQMKLIVLPSDATSEELVSNISRFANSQNKIKVTDFSSNHGYLRRLEKYSRRVTSNPGGTVRGTRWFFERTRGQYQNQINILGTEAEKRRFKETYPQCQLITKSDIPKYLLSWDWRPWVAAKSGEAGFIELAKRKYGTPEGICESERVSPWKDGDAHENPQFSVYYYKQLVAKAILYRGLDKAIRRQGWYKGYKTQIVTYTLALFHRLVFRCGVVFDLGKIWDAQSVPVDVLDYLLVLAARLNDYMWSCGTGANLFNLCNKETFWSSVTGVFGDETVPNCILKKWTLSLAAYRTAVDASQSDAKRDGDQSILARVREGTDDAMWLQMQQIIADRSLDAMEKFSAGWKAALDKRISDKGALGVGEAKSLLKLWDYMCKEHNFPHLQTNAD